MLADIVGGFAASMVIGVSDLHLAKAEVPMVSTPEPMVIEVRDEYWKQSLPMLFYRIGHDQSLQHRAVERRHVKRSDGVWQGNGRKVGIVIAEGQRCHAGNGVGGVVVRYLFRHRYVARIVSVCPVSATAYLSGFSRGVEDVEHPVHYRCWVLGLA